MHVRRLYHATLLEHHRNPHGFGQPETHDAECCGNNTLCGDRLNVFVSGDDVLSAVNFDGEGCAIMRASASLMCQIVTGVGKEEALQRIGHFRALLLGHEHALSGDVLVLEALRDTPTRLRCGMLPWETLKCALTGGDKTDTESDATLVAP